jgi:hypothetical protein
MTRQISDSEIAFQVQAHDRTSRRRFSDFWTPMLKLRRLGKLISERALRRRCNSLLTVLPLLPRLRKIFAAAAISRRAAYKAMANSVYDDGDETKWGFNSGLMREAYATIAVVY